MHIPTLLLTALTSSLALSAEFNILKPRNWDLNLLTPGCNPNSSNLDLSLYHRSGISTHACVSLSADGGADLDTSKVDSISWKSPISRPYNLCTFRGDGCNGDSFLEALRSDWSVCYPYKGWGSWRVVGDGEGCF